ncbi:putative transposase remnant (plasmid) [Yersinia enterocolitica subsp. palearctica Y11]|uniref:Putative transposase remnant n=1 Tax=Yersinia enterocolitica subsp. palearctica serotype O:3 (strain DSM 13030 / CIP 106945 / Y11) TaxID=930944 RepID=A0A0H3P163_YERE1|nr:putative transposase [Yersinia enterocolitica subsp. palearctica YE-149]CBY78141.1 putative transposase remnant [Yersinia enterocolitica subsp. palearctica Y11]
MMTEHGISVEHSTLHSWVIRVVPLLHKAFCRYKCTVGRRWRMDETSKVSGNTCTGRLILAVRLSIFC